MSSEPEASNGSHDSSTDPNYPQSEIHSSDGDSKPESIRQMKDRIMADVIYLKDDLVALNEMIVVDNYDDGTVGTIDVKFGDKHWDGTKDVLSAARTHPFHVEDVLSHGLICFVHEDRREYINRKTERRKM